MTRSPLSQSEIVGLVAGLGRLRQQIADGAGLKETVYINEAAQALATLSLQHQDVRRRALEEAVGIIRKAGVAGHGLAAAADVLEQRIALIPTVGTEEISQPYARELARQVDELEAENTTLRARISELEAGNGWRSDMENAPRDGTPILMFEDDERGPFKGWWHSNWARNEAYWMDHADTEPQPTHWRPLPAGPQQEDSK